MPKTNSLDFSSPASAEKALKLVSQQMGRAGQSVVTSEFSDKARRTAGVTYREASLTLASGQQVTLRVNTTGDIFQVLLNNQVKPIKEHADTEKAVAEIAAMAEKNQAAFQKAQARRAAALPKGMNTPRPKIADALRQQVAELDIQIAEKQATVAELKAKLGASAMSDSVPAELTKLDNAALDVLRALGAADRQVLGDGDVPSKQGRDALVELGLIDRYVTEGDDNVLNDKGREALAMLDSISLVLDQEPQAMPLASAFVAACAVVVADGSLLDRAQTAGAIGYLQVALDIMETNFPINLAEGNLEQARLEAKNAASFRAAITMLDSAAPAGAPLLEQLVEIALADVIDEDGISSQEALATALRESLVETSEGLYYLTEKGRQYLKGEGYDAYGKALAQAD